MINTVEELINHMKKDGANNLFVIGPYIGDYQIMTPEEVEVFKLKGLVREKEKFFNILTSKVLVDTSKLSDQLASIDEFINHYYMQTVNTIHHHQDKVTYLKGKATSFECSKCHAIPEVLMPNNWICECGGHIRPKCLLGGEQYDLELIQSFEEDLLKATTIFLIGFDFNELELCKQLEVIAARKSSGDKNMPIVVVVGECDKEGVYETFLPEFIVDERPESALERLINHF